MSIHSAQRIIHEIYVGISVNCSRQIYSVRYQRFINMTDVLFITIYATQNFSKKLNSVSFELRDGKSILFVMSPGPQPTSIHVPDILFKSLVNSFITIDTPRFCISLKQTCSAGFTMFNCVCTILLYTAPLLI
ncbi:hypothetical protein ALC56_01161 [Trachymyrmex septentrionalis]|uniref:Uncharacterized protein n=1 Tax=Trachymyrmex septentrionalis TaxID=34720 RepID=A0A195FVH6_9HYME|nr:hypothetical protein ALC56_01161 [Trachymyrmex septentrionalis]